MKRFTMTMLAMVLVTNALAMIPAPKPDTAVVAAQAAARKAAEAKAAAKEVADKAAAKMAVKNAMEVHAMMVKEKKTPAAVSPGCPTMAELSKAGLIDDLTAGQWTVVYKAGKFVDVERPRGAAATPKGTLNNLVKAIKVGSIERLMDCVTGTDDQKRYFALKGIEEVHYMYKLSVAMEAAYGKEAIEKSKMRPVREIVDMLKALQAARIEVDAATGTAQVYMVRPGRTTEKKLFKMIQEGGLWRIENPAVSRGRDISKSRLEKDEIKALAMKAAIEAVLTEIGKKGVVAGMIEDKLEAAMKAAKDAIRPAKSFAEAKALLPAAVKAAKAAAIPNLKVRDVLKARAEDRARLEAIRAAVEAAKAKAAAK